jgi:hypothetical protein
MDNINAALAEITTDAAPSFQLGGGWTEKMLTDYLERNGLQYTREGDKYKPADGCCWCCGKTDGNPAAWIKDGDPVYKCLKANTCNANWRDLQKKHCRLTLVNAFDLPALYPDPRPDVVCGLIRRGDVAGLVGGPKSRKSFYMEQMAISVAAGIPFLKWNTVQGRVLIIDNELRGDDLSRRLLAMVKAMNLRWEDVARQIDILPLRGKMADLHTIRDELAREPGRYSLTIIDAIYKAMPRGLEENSNSDMTGALVLLDDAAERHNCGLAFAHHLSKGNQAGKAVSDLGSGAGAQSRSVDAHLAMTPHAEENVVILQGVLRSQPPFAPVCLEFEYPLWKVAPDKDPTEVANPRQKSTPTLEEFLECISMDPMQKNIALRDAAKVLSASGKTVRILLEQAVQEKLVTVQVPANPKKPHLVQRVKAKAA